MSSSVLKLIPSIISLVVSILNCGRLSSTTFLATQIIFMHVSSLGTVSNANAAETDSRHLSCTKALFTGSLMGQET